MRWEQSVEDMTASVANGKLGTRGEQVMQEFNPSVCDSDVDRRISANDEMSIPGGEDYYFKVGRSALECIQVALRAGQKDPAGVKDVLDLPCGHGRVLRYLRAAFPAAQITACDLLRDGVDFCAATFGAVGVYSNEDPRQIPLPSDRFDLIWVGSLLTHLDQQGWLLFLTVLRDFLRRDGIIAFTTHGRECYRQLSVGEDHGWSGLPDALNQELMSQYERTGFGYVDYAGSNQYGLSLAKPEWVLAVLSRLDGLRVVHFAEKSWINHQDVFACVRDPAFPGVSRLRDEGEGSLNMVLKLLRRLTGRGQDNSEPRYRLAHGIEPLSYLWGDDRGQPLCRYYLGQFLQEFAGDIKGQCLEFEEDGYTIAFGQGVTQRDVMHVDHNNPKATIVADLTKPNDVPSSAFDCIICTHVLHIIFELDTFVAELKRLLKPGGVLLVGVPHVSMCGPEWHELWRFTEEGLLLLLSKAFGKDNVTTRAYGNSLTAAGQIRGLTAEEFSPEELDTNDTRFAVDVCARALKRFN
jgi:SAM-dependent methyltransferase